MCSGTKMPEIEYLGFSGNSSLAFVTDIRVNNCVYFGIIGRFGTFGILGHGTVYEDKK